MEKDYFQKLIGSMNFNHDIPREELRFLLKSKTILHLNRHEYFLQADEIPLRLGYVVSGLLRLYYLNSDGRELNKHFCVENSLAVDYSAFLRGEKSPLYIQALEDSRLFIISNEMYTTLLERHECWRSIARKLAEMLFILEHKREEELLTVDAQERYLRFLHDYPKLSQRLNQYHIASYLGITPESLSRIRSKH